MTRTVEGHTADAAPTAVAPGPSGRSAAGGVSDGPAVQRGRAEPGAPAASDADAGLWQRWRQQADAGARESLLARFLPYARVVAAMLYANRFHDEVPFDDYLQLASIGLIESVDRYDPRQGAQFKTFAAHRMRGAILNGLEKLTEKNQQIAAQKRIRKERLEALKQEAANATRPGKADPRATPGQLQQALLGYLAEVGIGLALGMMLEGTAMFAADDAAEAALSASPEVSYFRKSETRQLQTLLRELMQRLPAQERRVLQLHYRQEIPFDEISAMFGVTRGRISQLHRQALLSLRKALGQGPPCDIAW